MNPINGDGGNNDLNGTSANDTINGFGGNDTLEGFGGDDSLNGGLNDDTLIGLDGADTLNGGSGFDTALYLTGSNGVTVNLAQGFAFDQFGDRDTLISIEAVATTDRADRIDGSSRAETLNGRGGNDTIDAGAGNDSVLGGGGDDLLIGGAGQDTLSGSFGKNTFQYNSASDSTPDAPDIIRGFAPGSSQVPVVDVIDLRAMDADLTTPGNQAFRFIGNGFGGFTDAGQVRVLPGGLTFVQAEVNGDGIPDFEIVLEGLLGPLGAEDFML